MAIQTVFHQLEHLTFKGNLEHTRYGWLRLTPAHSIHLISDLLNIMVVMLENWIGRQLVEHGVAPPAI